MISDVPLFLQIYVMFHSSIHTECILIMSLTLSAPFNPLPANPNFLPSKHSACVDVRFYVCAPLHLSEVIHIGMDAAHSLEQGQLISGHSTEECDSPSPSNYELLTVGLLSPYPIHDGLLMGSNHCHCECMGLTARAAQKTVFHSTPPHPLASVYSAPSSMMLVKP